MLGTVEELADLQACDGNNSEMVHLVCDCDDTHALCGEYVEGQYEVDSYNPEDLCVVCADIDARPCERCGG